MDLTPEQKQRIEEEEQKKLAEEQYRAQVRARLQGSEVSSPAPQPDKAEERRSWRSSPRVPAVIGLGVVLIFVLLKLFSWAGSHREPSSPPVKASDMAVPGSKKNAMDEFAKSALEHAYGHEPAQRRTTAEIAQLCTPSVVLIQNMNEFGQLQGQGSGFVYSSDGLVVTNYHVVRGAFNLRIKATSQGWVDCSSLVGYDAEKDIAVLSPSGLNVSPLATDISGILHVGDRVVAIGAPMGLVSTVSEGIVSAMRDMGGVHIVQTSATISPGSSGGPLFNEFGRVVGIIKSMVEPGQALNFAVSSEYIPGLAGQSTRMSLSELRETTQVTDTIYSQPLVVGPRSSRPIPVVVPMQQGGTLAASFRISGGANHDIRIILTTADNHIIADTGRVSLAASINQRLPRGQYLLNFDNSFSLIASKNILLDVKLVSFR